MELLGSLEFLSIATKNSDAYLDGYFNVAESPLLWPAIMDTTEMSLWTAYEAGKDDMLLVDQIGGAAPLIVDAWMGSDKIYPSQDAGKEALMAAIDGYLLLP